MALFGRDVEAWSPCLRRGYATVIDGFEKMLGALRDLSRAGLLALDAATQPYVAC